MNQLITKLYDINCIKFGKFTLKSKKISPIYIDLRILISYPEIENQICELIWDRIKMYNFDVICGVAYGGLPIATLLSGKYSVPMILKRKEAKKYGTKKMIEGNYRENCKCLLLDDVITTGSSILEVQESLKSHGIQVKKTVVICDRRNKPDDNVISLMNITSIIDVLLETQRITQEQYNNSIHFIDNKQVVSQNNLSFELRLPNIYNNIQRRLYQIMINKQSNLTFAADITNKDELIKMIHLVGPYICILKTHIDIVENIDIEFLDNLKLLSQQYNFLIFEDRKFCDIGNTFVSQYTNKLFRINEWADIISIHCIAGPGILESFAKLSNISNKGILLVAEMSSSNNLIDNTYRDAVISFANKFKKNVLGFICQEKISKDNSFVYLTPGISFTKKKDTLDQNFVSPEKAILQKDSDIIIVGRGIYQANEPDKEAEKYKIISWNAYQQKIVSNNSI